VAQENEPLNVAAAAAAFDSLAREVNAALEKDDMPTKSRDEIAYGFIKVRATDALVETITRCVISGLACSLFLSC
jgi:hypothetical protein